jgi:hypothetical protein
MTTGMPPHEAAEYLKRAMPELSFMHQTFLHPACQTTMIGETLRAGKVCSARWWAYMDETMKEVLNDLKEAPFTFRFMKPLFYSMR